MARINPLSDVGCDSDSLTVATDIVGEMPRHPGLIPIGAGDKLTG